MLLQILSQSPPIHCSSQLCRNCCSKFQIKAAFSRQVCLAIASQFQLFRWSLGNRCICLRLKPLCPYYMRYHDPFIISYKKASVLQWHIDGKSLEDFKTWEREQIPFLTPIQYGGQCLHSSFIDFQVYISKHYI